MAQYYLKGELMKKILLLIYLAFFLTGCVQGNIEIEYQNRDQANLKVAMYCQEKLLSTYDTSLDELQNTLLASQFNTWQIKQIAKTINGSRYVGLELIAPEEITTYLLNFLSYDQKNDQYSLIINKTDINNIINLNELNDINNYSISSLENLNLDINLTISLPGTIQETSYGSVTNNQVKINLLNFLNQDKATQIKVISNSQSSNWQLTSFLIGGIIIILFFVLLKKTVTTFF